MKNRKILSLLLAVTMAAALLAVPAQAEDPPPAVRVSSYKGNTLEECEAAAASGYPNGFGSNITAFTGTATADIARQAVTNWLGSPGHRATMLDPDCECLGVGISESDKGVIYCYLFIGKPDTINPYG